MRTESVCDTGHIPPSYDYRVDLAPYILYTGQPGAGPHTQPSRAMIHTSTCIPG